MQLVPVLLGLLHAVSATESQLRWLPSNVERAAGPSPNTNDANNRTEAYWTQQAKSQQRHLCFIKANSNGGDDAPAIVNAFNKECRSKSIVVFPDDVYNIQTPMTTIELDDVHVNQYGRLLWSTDVDYWLSVSMPIGFQNQSTVWFVGGNSVVWDGYGTGTFDGNGQVWYDWAKSQGNLAHRPMNVNWRGFNNSIVRNMRFVQSQMWSMTMSYSKNLLFEDIYVNSTSTSQYSTLNTDGADVMWSDNITFSRWAVTNGDDSIALKGNSSNIYVQDCEFWNGQGIAVGSLGQFLGETEYVENFFVRNITAHNTNYAAYIKTWPGNQDGYPPNGGGGGLGYAKNIVMQDIVLDDSRGQVIYMEQCENYEGSSLQDCNSSKFKLEDVIWKGISGTTKAGNQYAGDFLCSAAAGGCSNITVEDFTVHAEGSSQVLPIWHCENLNDYHGFTCTANSTRP